MTGVLHDEMLRLKKYRTLRKSQNGEFKVIIVFHSVHDSLFNADKNQGDSVTKADYDKFLIDLTISYEFDYI